MITQMDSPKPSSKPGLPVTKSTTPSAAKSARLDKRMRWWYANMDKRLGDGALQGPPDGSSDATNNSKPHSSIPEKPWKEEKKKEEKSEYKTEKSEIEADADDDEDHKNPDPRKPPTKRFIVFVGQIPFNASQDEIRKLFEDVAKPGKLKSFRWRNKPDTKKFAGFAFVEFENKGAYRRAFELHHKLINGRPINVEATTTGGRRNKNRKQKITDLSGNFQKKAQEKLDRMAKSAAAQKKSKNVATPTSNGVTAKPEKPPASASDLVEKSQKSAEDKQDNAGEGGNKKKRKGNKPTKKTDVANKEESKPEVEAAPSKNREVSKKKSQDMKKNPHQDSQPVQKAGDANIKRKLPPNEESTAEPVTTKVSDKNANKLAKTEETSIKMHPDQKKKRKEKKSDAADDKLHDSVRKAVEDIFVKHQEASEKYEPASEERGVRKTWQIDSGSRFLGTKNNGTVQSPNNLPKLTGVQPRAPHLAGLGQPKHIKFDD